MSKREQCTSCGGFDFVAAIDNHGKPYQGCPRCVIAWPPVANADDGPAVAREVVDRSNRERLNSHANAVHTSLTLARAVIAQAEELAKLRADNDVLRTQVEHRAESPGLDDWARRLLDKYAGYPPFDSLDMGQQQMLIWEYASELLVVRGKRIDELRAAVAAYEREIDRIAHGNTIEGDAMCVNEVEVVNLRGDNAKLRAALREALGYAEQRDVMAEPGGWKRVDEYEARIVELRRLADGE